MASSSPSSALQQHHQGSLYQWRLAYKNMPVDLVLVRHGESEGNLAQKLTKLGKGKSMWTPEFRKRHNSKYRLTDRGRWQARCAGDWIKREIGPRFDLYLTSEYVRAMETAAMLGLEGAEWRTEFFLRERDRGVLANRPKTEREAAFPDELERQERDSFYFQPSGGESIANVCMRVEAVIRHLQKAHSGLKVIIVCHGGIIKAFRALIERRRQWDFNQAELEHFRENSGRFPSRFFPTLTYADSDEPDRVTEHNEALSPISEQQRYVGSNGGSPRRAFHPGPYAPFASNMLQPDSNGRPTVPATSSSLSIASMSPRDAASPESNHARTGISPNRVGHVSSTPAQLGKIYNGMIVHYTRKNPVVGLVSDHYNWVRTHCPWMALSCNPSDRRLSSRGAWHHFSPTVFSNDQIMDEISRTVPQLVNDDFNEGQPSSGARLSLGGVTDESDADRASLYKLHDHTPLPRHPLAATSTHTVPPQTAPSLGLLSTHAVQRPHMRDFLQAQQNAQGSDGDVEVSDMRAAQLLARKDRVRKGKHSLSNASESARQEAEEALTLTLIRNEEGSGEGKTSSSNGTPNPE